MLTSLQTSLHDTSLEMPQFKVGDVFKSNKKKDLPKGRTCPYFKFEELVDCDSYFGDTEKEFEITSIRDDIYYLKETSGTKSGIRIPSFVLQDFVDKKMWTKVDTASADTASAHNLYTNPDYNTIFYNGGTRKSKKRKTKKRKIIKRRKTRRR